RGGRILWGLQGGPLSSRGRAALLGAAALVLLLLMGSLSRLAALPRARTALAGAALLGIGFELWSFGGTWNTVCAKAPIFRATPALEFLYARLAEARARGDGEFRIWGATDVLPPNAASGVRLRDVRGYDAIECARWQLLQQSLLLLPALRSPLVEWPSSPAQLHVGNFPVEGAVMRGMGVRYALDRRAFAPELLAARGLRLAFPAASELPPRDGLYVYEPIGAEGRRAFLTTRAIGATEGAARLQAGDTALASELDRTLLLSDEAASRALAPPMTRGELRFELDEPDRVVLRIEGLDGEAWLALMDSAFPGWEATIDGSPAPIEVAQLAFRALRVPAGAQRVEFVYRPRSLRVGLALAALGIALAVVAIFFARRESARVDEPGRGEDLAGTVRQATL
ncbi:MAG: YfhO family protein, partial [Planctomycetes bacterium]|nr:YfhO family protein [Planctomycetota bacterium]